MQIMALLQNANAYRRALCVRNIIVIESTQLRVTNP